MYLALAAIIFVAFSVSAVAQMGPVGHWQTVDEKTQQPKSQVHITESGGVLTGTVEKLLRRQAKQDAVCTECSDDRKGAPLLGLEIIRGAQKAEGYRASGGADDQPDETARSSEDTRDSDSPAPGPRGRTPKAKRSSVPSWDDIVFGANKS